MISDWRVKEEPRRMAALRAVMARREIDAIVIVGGVNLSYFSGFAGLERSMARAMLYVCPREGEPALVAHTFRRHLLEAHAWVRDVEYFTQLSRAPVEELQRVLQRLGIRSGRLGFELGFESQVQMPQAEFARLTGSLSTHEIVDVAEDLWRIRYVRSPEELVRQREAARLATLVILESFAQVREGMLQREFTRSIQERMLAHGIGSSYALVSAGEPNYDFCGAWTPEYRFRKGDMVWVDVGVQSGGYCMAFSRAGVVGAPTTEQIATADAVNAATAAGLEWVRAGVSLAEVARVCRRELDAVAARVPVTTNIATLGTRFGHGMGLEFVEPPHVAEYEPLLLEPGMVVAVEPGLSTPYGRFHFREVAVVGNDGCELFAGPPSSLLPLPCTVPGSLA